MVGRARQAGRAGSEAGRQDEQRQARRRSQAGRGRAGQADKASQGSRHGEAHRKIGKEREDEAEKQGEGEGKQGQASRGRKVCGQGRQLEVCVAGRNRHAVKRGAVRYGEAGKARY